MAEPIKQKNGRWKIRSAYQDPITKQWATKMKTFDTKRECQDFDAAVRTGSLSGEIQKEVLLMDFFDLWFDTFKKDTVSLARQQKILLVKEDLIAFFGEKQKLKDINKIKYQQFLNWLGNERETKRGNKKVGLSKETVENKHAIFSSLILEAIDMRYITVNPCRRAKITGKERESSVEKTLDIEDLKILKNHVLTKEDCDSKFFILTQIYTGARYQEVAALQWNNLVESESHIEIKRAFITGDGPKHFGPTKSQAGVRNIDVQAEIFRYLKRHKSYQAQRVLKGEIINPYNLLFASDDTFPISNSAVNKYLKRCCNEAGIPTITSHGFRHTKTDTLVLAGNDIVYISNQIGHADINTTVKIYNKLNNDIKEKNKKIQENYLSENL